MQIIIKLFNKNYAFLGKTCIDYQEEVNPAVKDQRLQNENHMTESAIKEMIQKGEAMLCPRFDTFIHRQVYHILISLYILDVLLLLQKLPAVILLLVLLASWEYAGAQRSHVKT